MDHDDEDRITAVNRHLKGDKAIDICKDMKRSKSWFFKWLNKFDSGCEEAQIESKH
ncbi:MAG TPA: helix-turn-helix domain-containing protein [Candidatus Nanoarchaeia archaeon]|nr:helix-turn-helix domain-containing protein [Candidatus Nanoarchaeia archaeon]